MGQSSELAEESKIAFGSAKIGLYAFSPKWFLKEIIELIRI